MISSLNNEMTICDSKCKLYLVFRYDVDSLSVWLLIKLIFVAYMIYSCGVVFNTFNIQCSSLILKFTNYINNLAIWDNDWKNAYRKREYMFACIRNLLVNDEW